MFGLGKKKSDRGEDTSWDYEYESVESTVEEESPEADSVAEVEEVDIIDIPGWGENSETVGESFDCGDTVARIVFERDKGAVTALDINGNTHPVNIFESRSPEGVDDSHVLSALFGGMSSLNIIESLAGLESLEKLGYGAAVGDAVLSSPIADSGSAESLLFVRVGTDTWMNPSVGTIETSGLSLPLANLGNAGSFFDFDIDEDDSEVTPRYEDDQVPFLAQDDVNVEEEAIPLPVSESDEQHDLSVEVVTDADSWDEGDTAVFPAVSKGEVLSEFAEDLEVLESSLKNSIGSPEFTEEVFSEEKEEFIPEDDGDRETVEHNTTIGYPSDVPTGEDILDELDDEDDEEFVSDDLVESRVNGHLEEESFDTVFVIHADNPLKVERAVLNRKTFVIDLNESSSDLVLSLDADLLEDDGSIATSSDAIEALRKNLEEHGDGAVVIFGAESLSESLREALGDPEGLRRKKFAQKVTQAQEWATENEVRIIFVVEEQNEALYELINWYF